MLFSSAFYIKIKFLQFEIDTKEVGAREVRSVDVACIAVDAFVDVALEWVENILHTCIDF